MHMCVYMYVCMYVYISVYRIVVNDYVITNSEYAIEAIDKDKARVALYEYLTLNE